MMSNSIKLLEDRHLGKEICFFSWSDRMDLLAIANVQGEVSLHRLNWKLLWTLAPPEIDLTVRGISWRPDGKIIAIGYNDGRLLLVDVETKQIFHSQSFKEDFSSIVWLSESSTTTSNEERSKDSSSVFLPDLPDLIWVDGKSLDLLLIGTTSGKIYINIFGLLECAVVDLTQIVGEDCTIVNVHKTNNLDSLYVIVMCKISKIVKLVLLDSAVFQTHAKELHKMAHKHGTIISLLRYMDETITSVVSAWENILMEMDSKLAAYASTVPEGAVAADFLDLLLFGLPSDELDLFLTTELTEKGLLKLGSSIELSYMNIQKLVLKNLGKVTQSIMYHLIELRGFSRFKYRYESLGLDEALVSKAVSACGSFMVKSMEVQQVIDYSMRNFKTFFKWLYVVILRMNEEAVPNEINKMTQQEINFTAEFLQNFDMLPSVNTVKSKSACFHLERLGQYLLDAPLTTPLDTALNPWDVFLENHPLLSEHDSIIDHHKQMSLIQEHKNLIGYIEGVFNEPKHQICKHLHSNRFFDLIQVEKSSDLRVTLTNYDESTTFIAVVNLAAPQGVYLIEFTSSGDSIKTRAAFFYFAESLNVAKSMKVVDVQFYTVNVLSILLEVVDENRAAVLGQFSVTSVRGLLTDIELTFDRIDLNSISSINGCEEPVSISLRLLDGCIGAKLAVSGSRKLAAILMESSKRICSYEMEAEDEDDEGDITASTNRESDLSTQEINEQSMIE